MASLPVICMDFDGTLVGEDGYMHPADVEILTGETQVLFIPATSRPPHAIRRSFERNGLFPGQRIPFPLVLQNGAALYGPGEALLAYYPLPREDQDALLAISMRHTGICGLFTSLDGVHTWQQNDTVVALADFYDLILTPMDGPDDAPEFLKLSYNVESPALMEQFVAEIAAFEVERCFTQPDLLELSGVGINKGKGLLRLLEELDVTPEKIVVAGDGGNDVPMFEVADVAFAPATATRAALDAADGVIDVQKTGLLRPMLDALG